MSKTSTKRAPGSRPAVDRGIPVPVVDALIEVLGADEEDITLDSKLVDDLEADSLDLVELGMELEQHLGIPIDDEAVESWVLVADVVHSLKEAGAKL